MDVKWTLNGHSSNFQIKSNFHIENAYIFDVRQLRYKNYENLKNF